MKEKVKNNRVKISKSEEKVEKMSKSDDADVNEEETEDDFFVVEEEEESNNNNEDKIDDDDDIEDDEDNGVDFDEEEEEEEGEEEEEEEEEEEDDDDLTTEEKKLEVMKNKIKKSGVVYLSRIPPYMKPEKLKSLLSKYCKINRIYIVPEDESCYRRRVKKGGNKNRKYVEGWIEFVDKNKAKTICERLNNQPIGGKKRNYYHDDLWNMKYLKGFKWTHLTEKMRYEKIIREQKLKAELSQKTKATTHYLINSEKDERRSKFLQKKSEEGEEIKAPKFRRKIHQKSVIDSESFPLPKKSKTE